MLDLNKTEPQFFIDYKSNDKNYKKNPNNYLKCSFAIKQKLRQSILEAEVSRFFYKADIANAIIDWYLGQVGFNFIGVCLYSSKTL